MALQVRIVTPNFAHGVAFSNPIVLERADNISLRKTVSSSDESIEFSVPINDPKLSEIDYTKWWEVWDTITNQRVNYGPIESIGRATAESRRISGPGRSALLNDFYKSKQTWYVGVKSLMDSLRYENIAVQPRTRTYVPDSDSKYQGLSERSKDNIIDDEEGLFSRWGGQMITNSVPSNTYFTTNSFWAGTGKADEISVDLGGVYKISKAEVLLPWWGGPQRRGNRTYDFQLYTSPDNVHWQDDTLTFYHLYSSAVPNYYGTNPKRYDEVGDFAFFWGTSGYADVPANQIYAGTEPADIRYFKVKITNVHAWYGSVLTPEYLKDAWAWQCAGESDEFWDGDSWVTKESPFKEIDINTKILEPPNDCYASVVELSLYREILPRDNISNLALLQIENNNLQIEYSHTVDSFEMRTTGQGFRKFEPGSTFTKVQISWSNANTSYTKFYSIDCTDCYPSFKFAVVDNFGNMIFRTTEASGTITLNLSAATRYILMKGSATATVLWADTWRAKTDAFSYGASYSYTTHQGDTAIVTFRGESFKWWATTPSSGLMGQVKIEIRHKTESNNWTAWTTLEEGFELTAGLSAEKVWEITYESGYLATNTTYQIRFTNLNGGYVSIDSFGGYWSASMTVYNDVDARVGFADPAKWEVLFDPRVSGGTYSKASYVGYDATVSFSFVGDRVIIYGCKGYQFGVVDIIMTSFQGEDFGYGQNLFPIPGGIDPGYVQIDLDTGIRGYEIPNAILFDSNDYFPNGMPWNRYGIGMYRNNRRTVEAPAGDVRLSNLTRCGNCDETLQLEKSTVNAPTFFDGIAVHEQTGLSVKFINETHLEILKSTMEAVQCEWDITENGLYTAPRIGTDTEVILKEGTNVLAKADVIEDVSKVATMLIATGADIDGLPLFTIVEDKRNRNLLGRTIQRLDDSFSNVASYFQLVGLSRNELVKRREPEKRITVQYIGETLPFSYGDSFILKTKDYEMRVRVLSILRSQSASQGTSYEMECIKWPLIS